jgi:hypothetical protein
LAACGYNLEKIYKYLLKAYRRRLVFSSLLFELISEQTRRLQWAVAELEIVGSGVIVIERIEKKDFSPLFRYSCGGQVGGDWVICSQLSFHYS